MKRWEVDLGGHSEFSLRIADRGDPTARSAVAVRESLTYRMTPAGLEFLASFRLGIQHEPLHQILLEVPSTVQLGVTRIGETSVSKERLADVDGIAVYRLSFSEPVWGTDRELVVAAVAPIVLHENWQLPTMRLRDTQWLTGSASLEIVEPLIAAAVDPQDCIGRQVEPLPPPQRGELRQFQCVSPAHGWRLQLTTTTPELSAETGLLLKCTEAAVTGQFIADLQSFRRDSFELPGSVQPGWIIDSVQTDPPDGLEHFDANDLRQSPLRIHLRYPVEEDRKLRLIVRGHRRNLRPGVPVLLDNLRFFRLSSVAARNGLVAIAVEPPLRMTVGGDQDTAHVDLQVLSPAESTRLGAPSGAVCYRDVPSLASMSVSVSPEQPVYSADIQVKAQVEGLALTQTCDFSISPERSQVPRLLVRFSNPSPDEPTWSLLHVEDNSVVEGNSLSVRRYTAAVTTATGEVWEVTPFRPLNAPFVIRSVRKSKFSGEARLPLASIAEALSQSGTVRIIATDGSALQIHTRNMTAIATGRLTDVEAQSLRGEFRYLPSQESEIRLSRTSAESAIPAAWIWLVQLSSRISNAGGIEHEAQLYLENMGLSAVSVGVPKEATLLRSRVDDSDIDPDARNSDGRLVIPLPQGRRFPSIKLRYTTPLPTFRLASFASSAWPITELACFERRWNVWTAPGLVVAHQPLRDPALSWDQRLFGTTLVRRGLEIFDPFVARSWKSLGELSMLDRPSTNMANPDNTANPDDTANPHHVDTVDFSLWKSTAPVEPLGDLRPGWSLYTISTSDLRNAEVFVFSERILRAAGWVLLLVSFSFLYAASAAHRQRLAIVAIVTAVLLLVAPVDILPLLRGVFLGSLLACLTAWLPRPILWSVKAPVSEPSNSVRRDPATTVTLAVLTWIIAFSSTAGIHAQTRTEAHENGKPVPSKPVVYSVLVPVDDQQRPTDDYVYVPPSLFEELHRRLENSTANPIGPLIESAHYHVELASVNDTSERFELRSLAAEYVLGELTQNAQIRLPFRRDKVRVGDVRVDGQPTAFGWDENGQSVTVTIEGTDQTIDGMSNRLLRIVLRPISSGDAVTDEFMVPIPSVPHSRVTIHASGNLDHVDVPSSVGSLERVKSGELNADLGPARELHVKWMPHSRRKPNPPDADAAELLWLHVKPQSLIVRAQIKFAVREGSVDVIDVDVDPRLRLLPPTPDQTGRSEEVFENDKRLIRVWLDEPHTGQATIELSFASSGGLGNLVVPRITARAQRHAPTWLGVSVADELDANILPRELVTPLAATEFVQAWKRELEPLHLAVILPSQDNDCRLAIRPRPERVSAEQEIDLSLGYGTASIAYEAQFVAEHGFRLQQQLRVPLGFEPREVIVIHDDINRLLRWAHVDSSTLSVFFTVPIAGNFRVWVKGDLPLKGHTNLDIPMISPLGVEPVKMRVRVFRRSDLQVRIDETPGLVPNPHAAVGSFHPADGRLLAAFVASSAEGVVPSLRLSVTPNRPRIRGWQITKLLPQENDWWAETVVKLTASDGFLDAVRFRLPPELDGDLELHPPLDTKIVRVPGERGRRLVVRLADGNPQDVVLRFTGRLSSASPESPHAPDIQLLDATDVVRYVALPRIVEHRPLSWNTTGLQSAVLPAPFESDAAIELVSDIYQVMGSQMQAVLSPTNRIEGSPRVVLSDYRFRWFGDRRFDLVAAFDVEPAGADEVTLVMPAESELLHVTVGGLVTAPRRIGERKWRIPTILKYLPQRMELIAQGQLAATNPRSGVVTLPAPVLADVPVTKTLWTIQGPAEWGAGQPVLAHTRCGELAHAQTRLVTARLLWNLASARLGRTETTDAANWTTAWLHWMKQLEDDIAKVKQPPTMGAGIPASPRPTSRIDPTVVWGSRFDIDRPWTGAAPIASTATRCAMLGGITQLDVRYSTGPWRDWLSRCASALLLLAAVALAWRINRHPWPRAILTRYPELAVGVGGLVWWTFFVPSVVGLVILLFAVPLSLRTGWTRRAA